LRARKEAPDQSGASDQVLPAVPAASTLSSTDEEAEHPEDQPDHEQNPQDVKRWCYQSASTEEQKQQDQNDQCNHS
jgi:hypothetical protein